MGYDLHITRKADWFDESDLSITLEEWDAAVAGDPELLSVNFGGYFHSDMSGNIAAKNPEKKIRTKMHQIARRLGAKVQGDDGEFYGANGEPLGDSAKHHGITGRDKLFLVLLLVVVLIVLCYLR